MITNSMEAKFRDASVRLVVGVDEHGTIINIDNFPAHFTLYLNNHDARAFAERIINALDNARLEEAA